MKPEWNPSSWHVKSFGSNEPTEEVRDCLRTCHYNETIHPLAAG